MQGCSNVSNISARISVHKSLPVIDKTLHAYGKLSSAHIATQMVASLFALTIFRQILCKGQSICRMVQLEKTWEDNDRGTSFEARSSHGEQH